MFRIRDVGCRVQSEVCFKETSVFGDSVGKGSFQYLVIFYLLSLSSVIYYYFEASDENFLAWVGALSLFITGIVYLCIHFGWGEKLAKMIKKDEKNPDEVENVESQGR